VAKLSASERDLTEHALMVFAGACLALLGDY
jgi:hypothetical protein